MGGEGLDPSLPVGAGQHSVIGRSTARDGRRQRQLHGYMTD